LTGIFTAETSIERKSFLFVYGVDIIHSIGDQKLASIVELTTAIFGVNHVANSLVAAMLVDQVK
jgi:hypothetical protein